MTSVFFSYDYDANVLLSTIILQLVNMSKSHNNVHLITIIWSWRNTKLGRYVPPGVTDGWLMKLTLVSELRSCWLVLLSAIIFKPIAICCFDFFVVTLLLQFGIFNNYSSSPNGLWVNSPWGRRPSEGMRSKEIIVLVKSN